MAGREFLKLGPGPILVWRPPLSRCQLLDWMRARTWLKFAVTVAATSYIAREDTSSFAWVETEHRPGVKLLV